MAAGLAPLAIGTETDGSITCPASLNGVAGIKPSVGAVPTGGVVPISASQDSPGPLARTVDEVALLLEVLAATPGILDRARGGVRGVRVGRATTWRTDHPATDQLFEDTVGRLQAAGATVTEVDAAVPGPSEEEDELTVLLSELVDGLAAYLPTRGADGPQDLEGVVAHENAPRLGGARPLRARSLRAGPRAGRVCHSWLPGGPSPQPGLGGGRLPGTGADRRRRAHRSDLRTGLEERPGTRRPPRPGLTDHHGTRHRRLADRHRADGPRRRFAGGNRRRRPARFRGAAAGRVPGGGAAPAPDLVPARRG